MAFHALSRLGVFSAFGRQLISIMDVMMIDSATCRR
jgi:hypothetical protein